MEKVFCKHRIDPFGLAVYHCKKKRVKRTDSDGLYFHYPMESVCEDDTPCTMYESAFILKIIDKIASIFR